MGRSTQNATSPAGRNRFHSGDGVSSASGLALGRDPPRELVLLGHGAWAPCRLPNLPAGRPWRAGAVARLGLLGRPHGPRGRTWISVRSGEEAIALWHRHSAVRIGQAAPWCWTPAGRSPGLVF